MDPEIALTSAAQGLEIPMSPDIIDISNFKTNSTDCIFRASAHLRYGRESDFEPRLVSIGPYYHGRPNLKHMEDLKVRCMSDLLKMRSDGGSNIDRVPSNPFMRYERHARDFYKEKFDHSYVKFVEMLVLDSCFIIWVMLSLSLEGVAMAILDVNIKEIRSDLFLLENQIPLFFIFEVYSWLTRNEFLTMLPHLKCVVESFIRWDLPWLINGECLPINSTHLLDYYWKSSMPLTEIKRHIRDERNQQGLEQEKPRLAEIRCSVPKLIPNATELHQMAGINFEKLNKSRKLRSPGLQIEFSKGIIRMPCLKFDLSRTTILLNLIAFENSLLPTRRPFTTYIKFMDDLIDSEKDVELLQKYGVIYNTLSSHTKAATFFNDIGNFCLIDYNENFLSNLFRDVQTYYDSSWNRSWANLRQNYFSSPWAGISVIAGVVLLFLAAVQTYCTVFPKN